MTVLQEGSFQVGFEGWVLQEATAGGALEFLIWHTCITSLAAASWSLVVVLGGLGHIL
jgi:hypothetical protein